MGRPWTFTYFLKHEVQLGNENKKVGVKKRKQKIEREAKKKKQLRHSDKELLTRTKRRGEK